MVILIITLLKEKYFYWMLLTVNGDITASTASTGMLWMRMNLYCVDKNIEVNLQGVFSSFNSP